MPLSHGGLSAYLGPIFRGGELKSARLLAEEKDTTLTAETNDSILGTDDSVFTFAGPSLYHPSEYALIFAHSAEHGVVASASPFDSGSVFKHLRPHDSREEQISFFRHYVLPVPEYREYLARFLQICFATPRHYVGGQGPDFSGPIEVFDGDDRRWTFEVRFQRRLQLDGSLVALILSRAVRTKSELSKLIDEREGEGLVVKTYSHKSVYTEPGNEVMRLSREIVTGLLGDGDA
jgi:hypothetical protein